MQVVLTYERRRRPTDQAQRLPGEQRRLGLERAFRSQAAERGSSLIVEAVPRHEHTATGIVELERKNCIWGRSGTGTLLVRGKKIQPRCIGFRGAFAGIVPDLDCSPA